MASKESPHREGGAPGQDGVLTPVLYVRTRVWPVTVDGGWKSIATDAFWLRLNKQGMLGPEDYLEAVDAMDAADAGEALILVDDRYRYYVQRGTERPRFCLGVAVALTQFPRRTLTRGLPRLQDVEAEKETTRGVVPKGTLRALHPSRTWMGIYFDFVAPRAATRRERLFLLVRFWQAHRGQLLILWDERTQFFAARRGVARHSPLLTDVLDNVPMDVLDPLRGEPAT